MAKLHGTMVFMRKAWDFQDAPNRGGVGLRDVGTRDKRERKVTGSGGTIPGLGIRLESVPIARDLGSLR